MTGSLSRKCFAVVLLAALCACSEYKSDPGSPKPPDSAFGPMYGGGAGGTDTAEATAGSRSPGEPADAVDAGPKDPWDYGVVIPRQPQKEGDPEAGYKYLTGAGYFGCGIPKRFYSLVGPAAALPGQSSEPLPDRDESVDGQPLPYKWNLDTNAENLEVVYMNCLQCHAGKFNGKLIVGLGDADGDWTANLASGASAALLLKTFLPTPAEQRELDKFFGRLDVIGPAAVMRTVGTNPAEMLATTFVSHRDRDTLAWSATPLLTIPAVDELPEGSTIISKVPPWWRMSKKSAQFYTGMGRGDHRRSMMLAGSLCTDTVQEAEAIDAHFNDVSAFIHSVKPPKYPFPIDEALADHGRTIFGETCGKCHGSYAPDAVAYPNLVIPQEIVETDPVVALGGTSIEYGADLVTWYNESWYGQVGPYVPYKGYMAPPLDAVWATAPYLHNGSVPDIATLLDSQARPTYWQRVDHDSTNYDEETLGFPWRALATGQDAPPFGIERKHIYDTTQYSHSNAGHTYGDELNAEQRRAIIEYLKTL